MSLLMHDAKRQPIDASPRRRHPTRRQRRVLDERDPECQQPGCHAEVFLQYDHIQPYSHDGPTVIANLQRLCGPHNRGRQPT
ncbi:MAG: HNH endonuclease signature motif containing protein [Aquihabitans sp.]